MWGCVRRPVGSNQVTCAFVIAALAAAASKSRWSAQTCRDNGSIPALVDDDNVCSLPVFDQGGARNNARNRRLLKQFGLGMNAGSAAARPALTAAAFNPHSMAERRRAGTGGGGAKLDTGHQRAITAGSG
jgi:hypothetical protein